MITEVSIIIGGLLSIIIIVHITIQNKQNESKTIQSTLIYMAISIAFSLGLLSNEFQYVEYDYFINLDHHQIQIDTDYGETIWIPATESIDSVIINDNI